MMNTAKHAGAFLLAAMLFLTAVSPFTDGPMAVLAASSEDSRTVSGEETGAVPVSALYLGETEVKAVFSGELEEDQLSLLYAEGPQGEIAVTDIRHEEDAVYTLTLKKKLESLKAYRLYLGDASCSIVLPNNYSTNEFEYSWNYYGTDLGLVVGSGLTFKVWAPMATQVYVNFYKTGNARSDDLIDSRLMARGANGVYVLSTEKELLGSYYTYKVVRGTDSVEVCDPYACSAGLNGERAMALDLSTTNPADWSEDENPNADLDAARAVLYEANLRDLSTDENSGITYAGKYLSLAQRRTRSPGGDATGLDHIRELGVTHVRLSPMTDFGSLDESMSYSYNYDLGYSPVSFHVPEGSYATDASDGRTRVKELKEMVKALHDSGLSVIMDMDYSHVFDTEAFAMNKILPGFSCRVDENGIFSDGSGFGNDMATERTMLRKYLVDCAVYWAREYHMDGFYFVRSGILDTVTMNQIMTEVLKVRPDAVFYADGALLDTQPTKTGLTMTTKENAEAVPGLIFADSSFSEEIVGNDFVNGYVLGSASLSADVQKAWLGKTELGSDPEKALHYISAQDGLTGYDRISRNLSEASAEKRIRLNNLAAAISLTAQGIPSILNGEEMLRSRVSFDGGYDSESYGASDEVNSLKWSTLGEETVRKTFEYYKGLVAFRRAHPSLSLSSGGAVEEQVTSVIGLPDRVLGFSVSLTEEEAGERMYVLFNPTEEKVSVSLPAGSWNVYVDAANAGTEPLYRAEGGKAEAGASSALILVKEDKAAPSKKEYESEESEPEESEPGESDPGESESESSEESGTESTDPGEKPGGGVNILAAIGPFGFMGIGAGIGLFLLILSLTLRKKR